MAIGAAIGVIACRARADDRDAADGRAVQRRRRRRGGADRLDRVSATASRSGRRFALEDRRSRPCSPRSSARSRSGARSSPSGSCRRSCPAGRSSSPARRSSTPCCCSRSSPPAWRSLLAAAVALPGAVILGILLAAAVLGNMVVLPIGGADMPVVISLLNAFTGLVGGGHRLRAQQHRADRRRHARRRLGHDPHHLMAKAMNRSVRRSSLFGGFGAAPAAARGRPSSGPVRSISAEDVAIQLSYADRS